MIITKTPYRVSLFGGGTDYPEYFEKHPGAVIGSSIDKYCYVTCRWLPPFHLHRHRIVYSKTETVVNVEDIQHPIVRESLRYLRDFIGTEIHHDGDLPASSGVGSSSAFAVGLLHALHTLHGDHVSQSRLAVEATYVEREMVRDIVGHQDQIMAAHGGFNHIKFKPENDYDYDIEPIDIKPDRLRELEAHLMLIFIGNIRTSSTVAASYINWIRQCRPELRRTYELVEEAKKILTNDHADLREIGKMLNESWLLKQQRSKEVSNNSIDTIYDTVRRHGAIGGKIIGAGGGGFMLVFAEPECQKAITTALDDFLRVPFRFENDGSQVIFNNEPKSSERGVHY
jgi:D-glycero-alpha-D-manno-heptose-7-phosphate kinase